MRRFTSVSTNAQRLIIVCLCNNTVGSKRWGKDGVTHGCPSPFASQRLLHKSTLLPPLTCCPCTLAGRSNPFQAGQRQSLVCVLRHHRTAEPKTPAPCQSHGSSQQAPDGLCRRDRGCRPCIAALQAWQRGVEGQGLCSGCTQEWWRIQGILGSSAPAQRRHISRNTKLVHNAG